MKRLLLLLFFAITIAACNNPNGQITGVSKDASGWENGQQTFTEYVYMQPTWGQAFYYNMKSGGTWELITGFIFFFVAVMWFILLSKQVLKSSLTNILGFVICLAASLAFIFTQPGTIKWNNNIKIEKSVYEQRRDNLRVLWDDLYYQKRIIGTSGK